MAGHILNDDPLGEDHLIDGILRDIEDLIDPNDNLDPTSTLPNIKTLTNSGHDALITNPPVLELRQNNPQDCANLIAASVDRATVEISRTIIRLNATFSQQLQAASISASNGIKSAQDQANQTISSVSSSASIVTSSAFFSLTLANKAQTSVQLSANDALSSANASLTSASASITGLNLALANVSSVSRNDVASLSSSLRLLQASVTSLQSSASAAIAAAQAALISATGSAAIQASSILASAARATQSSSSQTIIVNGEPIQAQPQPPTSQTISLTPAQAAGIVVGAVVFSVLLSFAIYFLVLRTKKAKERDSYLDEKEYTGPKKMHSRMSSTLRTGTGMTLKFNPPKSSDSPPPARSALRQPNESMEIQERNISQLIIPDFGTRSRTSSPRNAAWPLSAGITTQIDLGHNRLSTDFSNWPLSPRTMTTAHSLLAKPRSPAGNSWPLQITDSRTMDLAPSLSPLQIFDTSTKLHENRSGSGDARSANVIPTPLTTQERGNTTDATTLDPFADPKDEEVVLDIRQVQQTSVLSNPEQLNPFEDENIYHDEGVVAPVATTTTVVNENDDRKSEATEVYDSTEHQDMHREERSSDEHAIEAIVPVVSQTTEQEIPAPAQNAALSERMDDLLNLENLLPPQRTRAPAPETRALLETQQEPRDSKVPEIDNLIRIIAKQNEDINDKPLFWTDYRAPDPEVERAASPPPLRSMSPIRSPSPAMEVPIMMVEENQNRPQEWTQSPPRTPKVEDSEHAVEPDDNSRPKSPTNDVPETQRETSPLRMNPQVRNITSLLAENGAILLPQSTATNAEPSNREVRGRSMIRTSDIIEARLSNIMNQKPKEKFTPKEPSDIDDRERTLSPLRRNPVDLSAIPLPSHSRNRTLSPDSTPPKQDTTNNRNSRSLSPAHAPKIDFKTTPKSRPISRSDSPLRRNPSTASTHRSRTLPRSLRPLVNAAPVPTPTSFRPNPKVNSRPESNMAFSQTLARFQSLAENGIDGVVASNEVTSRAIAGIYIPGSLREQAVRNLSRSRDRGGGKER